MTRELHEAVDALLDHAFNLSGLYESLNFEDRDLRAKLRKIAALRPLTLADLDRAIREVEAETTIAFHQTMERIRSCNERKDDLKVFYVVNTSDNRLTVLARDAKCARHFAYQDGHILELTNGRVLVMSSENEMELRKSGKALGRALREGFPGAVSELGDNIVMARTKMVYTPMTIV